MSYDPSIDTATTLRMMGGPTCGNCKKPLELVGVKVDSHANPVLWRVHLRCPTCDVASCMIHRPETAMTAPPVTVPEVPVVPPVEASTIAAASVQRPLSAPDPDGVYYCEECKSNHKYSSRVGKDHISNRRE